MELPLFVVHGAVVWKLLLAAVVAISLGIVALVRRRKERTLVGDWVAARLAEVTPLQAGSVVLRGKLATGTASTSEQDIREGTSERSAELTLDHEGEKVAIQGPVTVEHGSQTAIRWVRKIRTRTVRAGDEVLVVGTASRRAEDDAGYRDAGIGWEVGDDAHIIAVKPQARPRPNGIAKTLLLAAVFGLVGYGALRLAGNRAMKAAYAHDVDRVRRSLGNSDAVAIAAAMPGSREKALEELSYKLERGFERTEEVFQLRLALDVLRGECTAFQLSTAVRLEEAVVVARACGEPVLASQALAFLGKFEDAWNERGRDARPYVEGVLAIATGRWREAAAAADARVPDYEKRERSKYYTELDAQRSVLNMRCLAALFRSWAGDKGAFDKIEGRLTNQRCRVFAALALPQADQGAALAAITFTVDDGDYDAKHLVEEVRRVVDPATPWPDWYRHTVADIVAFGITQPTWFAPAHLALGRTDLSEGQLQSLLAANAGLRAFRGDLAGARGLLERAHAVRPNGRDNYTNELALGLLDPSATLPDRPGGYVHPGLDEMVELRRGQIPRDVDRVLMGSYSADCKARLLPAVRAAQGGDGEELAAVLRDCRISWNTTQKGLLAVMPRVKTHRAEVAAGVRMFTSDSTTFTLKNIPFQFLEDIGWYRNLATAIGDTERAAHWQVIFDRHATLLDDQQKLIAFWMWGD
ncbi:MAG: hypothetical protein H0T46_02130 [Deltaproteobacteria bacterium]|nr:hypothetical protein [Deltaproteobacteria bacterium]